MELTEQQREQCHLIIHGAAASAATVAATMAQAPGTDNVPLVAIEMAMVISLGRVFSISLTESGTKSTVAGTAGTLVGRGVSIPCRVGAWPRERL